jgi:hypothetical protein
MLQEHKDRKSGTGKGGRLNGWFILVGAQATGSDNSGSYMLDVVPGFWI